VKNEKKAKYDLTCFRALTIMKFFAFLCADIVDIEILFSLDDGSLSSELTVYIPFIYLKCFKKIERLAKLLKIFLLH